MDTLQKVFDNALDEHLQLAKLGVYYVKRQARKNGITLSDEQIAHIEHLIEANINFDSISFRIDSGEITFQIDDEFNEFVNELEDKMSQLINDLSSEFADKIFVELTNKAPHIIEDWRKQIDGFQERLQKRWAKSFDLMQLYYVIAYEAGESFNRTFRPVARQEQDAVFEVLTRLHARACQVYAEVLTLLRAGFADGAHARWRTLHEIAVVAFFVKKFGNDTAERYLLHDRIESYKAALQHHKYASRINEEAPSAIELARIKARYDVLVKRYGSSYKENYGWAAVALGKNKPTFADIEEIVSLEHLRPYYKLASHSVHANPKGIFFKLGLYPDRPEVLLSGPSDTGFADPGHSATISLGQVTVALLTSRTNIDGLIICKTLFRLEKNIGRLLLQIQNQREQVQHRRYRRYRPSMIPSIGRKRK